MNAVAAARLERGWACDDAFLAAVEGADGRVIVGCEATAYFDVEVLIDPHVDAPAPARTDAYSAEQVDTMRQDFLDRVGKLREPFGSHSADLVIALGGATVEPPAGEDGAARSPAPALWEGAFAALAPGESPHRALLAVPESSEAVSPTFVARWDDTDDRPVDVVASIHRLCLPDVEEPFAYVAALGFPFAPAGEPLTRQLTRARRLIRGLATTVGLCAPVYVVVARRDGVEAAPAFLGELERLRVSLLITGPGLRPDVVTLSRASRDPHGTDVSLVTAPTFKRGEGVPGLARVRIDTWKGQAEIAFRYDRGSDRREPPRQVIRPLESASRVTPGERRLRRVVDLRLTDAVADVSSFREHVDRTWRAEGYVPLTLGDGSLPALPARRVTHYKLLVLLREANDGSYQVLLSRHTPRSPSRVAEWESLLLPAFTSLRSLLEHLRDDVVRQSIERSTDLETAERARLFQRAVERILAAEEPAAGDVWADKIREVAQMSARKISPTEGIVTEYHYQLVTVLPLVERHEPGAPADGAPGERDAAIVADWLARLETVPLEAVSHGGSGLRPDPQTTLVDPPGAGEGGRPVPRGTVWFPLGEPEDRTWRSCPALVARNADVMSWLDAELRRWRVGEHYAPEIVLGKAGAGSSGYEIVDEFPFEARDDAGPVVETTGARSTREALARVTFLGDGYDLAGRKPYEGATVERVFLLRKQVEPVPGVRRDVILVFSQQLYYEQLEDLTHELAIGVLRPVQRYVLTVGLERAREIDEEVRQRRPAGADEWGFVRVRKGAAPQPVAVTPPIVEELPLDDREAFDDKLEFVVCDGNHRVVQSVWKDGRPLPAVALCGPIPEPYYARPFGRYEWGVTADNELLASPDLWSKYVPRPVPEEIGERLAAIPAQLRHRRFFRDLTRGFGPLGGQGGRYY